MSTLDPKDVTPESSALEDLLLRAFLRLRSSGFQLGVSEYMAALKAVEGGFAETAEALEETLKLLWCHSLSRAKPLRANLERHSSPAQRPKTTQAPLPQSPKATNAAARSASNGARTRSPAPARAPA